MAVYLIQCGGADGPVKIGTSSDPEKRLKTMQPCCPYKLSIIREMEGGSAEEAWLHKRYAKRRLSGEWFSFDSDMLFVGCPPQVKLRKYGPSTKLKAYLERHGLTQAKFAAQIGRNVSTVSRIISGDQFPTPDTIRVIMEVTRNRVKANDFVDGA